MPASPAPATRSRLLGMRRGQARPLVARLLMALFLAGCADNVSGGPGGPAPPAGPVSSIPPGHLAGSFPLSAEPRALAADAAGNVWVVTATGVSKFDANGTSLGSFTLDARAVAVTSGGEAWVATDAGVTKPGGTLVPIADHPVAVAVDGEGSVWVARSGTSRLTKLSAAGTLLGEVDEQGSGPMAMASRGDVWVLNQGSANLSHLSTVGSVLGLAPVPGQPLGLGVAASGNVWVVATRRLLGYSAQGVQLVSQALDSDPVGVAAGSAVWVAAADGVTSYDEAGRALQHYRLEVPAVPKAIALAPDGTAWVACTPGTLFKLAP